MAEGRCLCGTLRYVIDGPFNWMGHCHCSMCRKHHGSLFATFVGASASHFRWLAGEHQPLHIVLVVVEHHPLVRSLGRCDRHERIPALRSGELIQPIRFAPEPFEDASAGQPHHLTDRGDPEPR